MGQTTDDLKKILVYVNLEKPDDATLKTLVANVKTKSAGDYKDKVFFMANTGEIIVQGTTFGVSDEFRARVDALETKAANLETTVEALTGLTGVPGTAAEVSIADDSVIGKYVEEKILANKSVVDAADDSVAVTSDADAAGTTTYHVAVEKANIIDGKTLVVEDGKIKTGFELVYTTVAQNSDNLGHNDKQPHITMLDADGAEMFDLAVGDFVTDGMIDNVTYNETDGTITFVWNADGKHQETTIELAKIFQIEGIHTATPDYIDVKKETPGDDQDADKKLAYHVDAVVDTNDLKTLFSVSHTGDASDVTTEEKYATNYDNDDALGNALATVKGLADANKVATKFAQIDKDIVAVGTDAIARTKAANKDIEDKIAALRADLDTEIADRGDADDKLQEQITANKDAIDVLNGNEDTTGSVANSIKLFKESLDSDQTYNDENGLVIVKVEMEDGAIKAQADHNVTVKTDTLLSSVQEAEKADFIVTSGDNTVMYTTRNLTEVAAKDPALVTTQDAWVYGQCIKSQAINAINSDDNEYIQIARVANADGNMITKVVFTPWGEVHNLDELASLK